MDFTTLNKAQVMDFTKNEKKVLMGKDQSVATQKFQGNSNYIGRLLFAHKLNI